jgi:hypothetical protein
MTTSTQTNVKSLASSAMLVSLNISLWTARKMAKKVANDVDQANGTKTKVMSAYKALLAGDDELIAINKYVGVIRSYHINMTSPWSDSGARLLTTAQFFIYRSEMARMEAEFGRLVADFIPQYGLKISAAAFQLGSLFDRDEYPDPTDVARKFGMSLRYEPLPEVGDFRIDIGNEGIKELQESYASLYEANIEKVHADAYDRLYKILTQLSFGLRTNEDGSKGKVFDSVLDNTKELCGLLSSFNIKGDTQLEAMRIKLEDSFTGIDAQDIKKSDYIRITLKRDVDSMLDKWN